MSHKKLFLKASFLIGLGVLGSKVLGLVREQYTFHLFGASLSYDAYVSASKIPNVFRNLLAEGAFSAVFISIFARLYSKNKERAMNFAHKVISYLLVISVIIIVIGVIAAPLYLKLIHSKVENFQMVVHLTYYVMPFLTFISIAAILMGILNSWSVYFIPAIAPLFGNIAYLATVFLLNKKMQADSLALAFLLSSIVYVIVQIPMVFKKGFKFKFNFKIDHDLKRFFKFFMPVALGMAVFQLNRIISNKFSSSIEGGNTLFEKSFIITQLILSVLITGISTVALPLIAKETCEESKLKYYIDSLKLVFLIVFPFTVFCFILGEELGSFIYRDILHFVGAGEGKITGANIKEIGAMLLYFAPAVTLFGLTTIINRAFQGIRKFAYPVVGSFVSVALNITLMNYLFPRMGLQGLALSISIAAFFNFLTLFILFNKKMVAGQVLVIENRKKGVFVYRDFFLSISKAIISGLFVYIFVFFAKKVSIPLFYKTPLLILCGIIIYFISLFLLRQPEILSLYEGIKRKLKPTPKK